MSLRAIRPDDDSTARRVECPLCGAVEDADKKQTHTVSMCRQRILAQRTYWQNRALRAEETIYRWAENMHPLMEEINALPPRE